MKIYTHSGDDGSTGLYGNQRLSKSAKRIAVLGEIDELNAWIGMARSTCSFDALGVMLDQLQNWLFEMGADVATLADSPLAGKVKRMEMDQVTEMERWIDGMTESLAPMRHFILPGGTELAARLHLARAVCRRGERALVELGQSEKVNAALIPFVNRLSDLLFTMAREANRLGDVSDVPWKSGE